MPIRDYLSKDGPQCSCCGEITRSTTGLVEFGDDSANYIARWTPASRDDGIALLLGLGDGRGFVSAKYSFEIDAITVLGPQDYDWQKDGIAILSRDEVIGTPLASRVFRVIDEIWNNDPQIQSFIATVPNPSRIS